MSRILRQAMMEHSGGGGVGGGGNSQTQTIDGFRIRGTEVSRLEAFSDSAFAFAVTLVVVSLEAPKKFDDLIHLVKGMPAFAICFALLTWLWYKHYIYFRRFGLQDHTTVLLNSILLFVVLFYVYPLKFLYWLFIGSIMDRGDTALGHALDSAEQMRWVFMIFGVGTIAVHGVFAIMNHHALRKRTELDLNEFEQIETRCEIARAWGIGAVGLLSCLIALLAPTPLIQFAGWIYCIIGGVEAWLSAHYGKKKRLLEVHKRIGA